MQTAIIGPVQSGKSTLLTALTGGGPDPAASRGKGGQTVVEVEVPDERVERLAALFSPRKKSCARIGFREAPGLDLRGKADAVAVAAMRNADALTVVVRAYGSEDRPAAELREIVETLVMLDLEVAERRAERLRKEGKRGGREEVVLERILERLSEGAPLGMDFLQPADRPLFSGFGFLTAKPAFVVINTGDEAPAEQEMEATRTVAEELSLGYLLFRGDIETEIAQLQADEQREFLEEIGMEGSARDRLLRELYARLNLMSFLTAGEDEVRAWSIERGTTAEEAAGKIHSDLRKGFIRAEVVWWEDLLAAGGFKEAKRAGKLRLEGKAYVVRDGDVLTIRFNL